jgi:hypothetical protein
MKKMLRSRGRYWKFYLYAIFHVALILPPAVSAAEKSLNLQGKWAFSLDREDQGIS